MPGASVFGETEAAHPPMAHGDLHDGLCVADRRRAHHAFSHGLIAITSQRTPDRQKNLADARAKLAALIAAALIEPNRRRPTKPSKAARRRRLQQKRAHAEKKRERRHPQPSSV